MNIFFFYTGTKTLFKVSPSSESVIHQSNLHITSYGQFILNYVIIVIFLTKIIVTRITRTSKIQVLDTFNMFATLLLLAPDHGHVTYKWERRNARAGVWELIDVPPFTCLLYVDQPGDYMCQMGGENFYFNVLCRGKTVHAYDS